MGPKLLNKECSGVVRSWRLCNGIKSIMFCWCHTIRIATSSIDYAATGLDKATTLIIPVCYETSVTEKPRRIISIGVVNPNIIGKVLVEVRYPRCGHHVSGGEVAGVVAKVVVAMPMRMGWRLLWWGWLWWRWWRRSGQTAGYRRVRRWRWWHRQVGTAAGDVGWWRWWRRCC